jgi:hypothetical protein
VTESIFTTQAPAHTDKNDAASYTLSSLFSSDVRGNLLGVRWYFPATLPSGPVLGGVFAYAGETSTDAPLAQATFANPVAGTWNVAMFAEPVEIQAGALHYASIQTPDHYVSSDHGSWATIANGHLTLYADNQAGGQRNGRYFPFAVGLQYPNGSVGDLYFADVIFAEHVTPPPIDDVPDITVNLAPARYFVHIASPELDTAVHSGLITTHISG